MNATNNEESGQGSATDDTPDFYPSHPNESFLTTVGRAKDSNSKLITQRYACEISQITEAINLLHRLLSCHVPSLVYVGNPSNHPAQSIIFSACHKNLFAFVEALQQTCDGFYGAARLSLAYAFEAQLLAKYCSISHDRNTIKMWGEGVRLDISEAVFDKMTTPLPEAMRELWVDLAGFTHPTVYAQQVGLRAQDNLEQIGLNFIYLQILLLCQHHIFASHFLTQAIRYYASNYGDESAIQQLKRKIRKLGSTIYGMLTDRPKQVVREFRTGWVLAS